LLFYNGRKKNTHPGKAVAKESARHGENARLAGSSHYPSRFLKRKVQGSVVVKGKCDTDQRKQKGR